MIIISRMKFNEFFFHIFLLFFFSFEWDIVCGFVSESLERNLFHVFVPTEYVCNSKFCSKLIASANIGRILLTFRLVRILVSIIFAGSHFASFEINRAISLKNIFSRLCFQDKMNELDSLRQEAETLKNAIRVSFHISQYQYQYQCELSMCWCVDHHLITATVTFVDANINSWRMMRNDD